MFHEILVIDYISDFKKLTQTEFDNIKMSLMNPEFLNNCPNGTIIGIPIDGSSNNQSKVYYPMLSHISMPIKSGERAWAFDQPIPLVSYWLSRKVQNTTAEDLNFTHDDRARLYPSLSSDPEGRKKNSSFFYDARMTAVPLTKVRNNSFSRKNEFVGEPTLSLASKTGDLTLQGSNGTVINLTNQGSPQTPVIELIAGLSAIRSDSIEIINNSEGYEETVKPPNTLANSSPDDSSKLTISQNFDADDFYKISESSGKQNSVVVKTDGVRIIAKNDLKIIVGNSDDPSSIIMKSNGDIIITPSKLGIIKLGGEDASGAILATETSVVSSGIVTAPAIVSTAGGIIGSPTTPGTGLFSTKVLVKVR